MIVMVVSLCVCYNRDDDRLYSMYLQSMICTTPSYVAAVLLLLGTTHIFHSALGKTMYIYTSLSGVIQLKCVNLSIFKTIFHSALGKTYI